MAKLTLTIEVDDTDQTVLKNDLLDIDAWVQEVAAVEEATTDIDPEIVVEAVAAQAGAEAVAISELSTFIV